MMHSGLQVYKYIFENGSLDNGADNQKNKCFCRKNKCLKPGLIDVTDCYYGKVVRKKIFYCLLSRYFAVYTIHIIIYYARF